MARYYGLEAEKTDNAFRVYLTKDVKIVDKFPITTREDVGKVNTIELENIKAKSIRVYGNTVFVAGIMECEIKEEKDWTELRCKGIAEFPKVRL